MTRRITEALHLEALPPGVRETLDSWRFWTTILALAVAGLFIWAIVNTNEIAQAQARQTRDEAVKTAEVHAAAQSAYTQCVNSSPELARVSRFIAGVNLLASVLSENSAAILQQTDPHDPAYNVRLRNLARVDNAYAQISAVHGLHVPSLPECERRRQAILHG